jgi:hypothetical protein
VVKVRWVRRRKVVVVVRAGCIVEVGNVGMTGWMRGWGYGLAWVTSGMAWEMLID